MPTDRRCLSCQRPLGPDAHHLRLRCQPCAQEAGRRRPPTLTPEQVKTFHTLVNRTSRQELARAMGISQTGVTKLARSLGISVANHTPRPVALRTLYQYAQRHGEDDADARYGAAMDVRALLDERRQALRWTAWTDAQVVEAIRMGPFLPFSRQGERIGRPRASEQAFTSFWHRVVGMAPTELHGLSGERARIMLRKGAPFITLPVLRRRRRPASQARAAYRRLVLWVDAGPYLRSNLPPWVRGMTDVLSVFQRWLYATDDVRAAVCALQQEVAENAPC